MTFSVAALSLGVAVVTGLFSLITAIVSRPRQRQVQDAWQAQAEKLRNELRVQHQSEVGFYRGMLEAQGNEIARLTGRPSPAGRPQPHDRSRP